MLLLNQQMEPSVCNHARVEEKSVTSGTQRMFDPTHNVPSACYHLGLFLSGFVVWWSYCPSLGEKEDLLSRCSMGPYQFFSLFSASRKVLLKNSP